MPTMKRHLDERIVVAGTLTIGLEGVRELQDLLLKAGRMSAELGDRVIAETAAIGRRAAMDTYETGHLTLGPGATRLLRADPRRGTLFDRKLGGYRTSDGGRVMQFSFENTTARKSKTAFAKSVSKLYVTDRVANLWEQRTKPYATSSPAWVGRNGIGRWRAGTSRPPRPFFMTSVRAIMESAIPEAIRNASERIAEFKKENRV